MKTVIAVIVGVLFCLTVSAQTADQDVANGLNYLANQDLADANQQFTAALALSPTNASANALVAVTRLLTLPATTSGSNFLNSLGFSKTGRDVFNWTSKLPTNINSHVQLPSANTSTMIAFYRTNVMAALAASRTNLANITDPTFTLSLTADQTSLEAVTIDYGDILLLQAFERMAEFAGYTANAQNGDVVLSQLQSISETGSLNIQTVLSQYPSLLTLANAGDLAASKGALTNAISLYFAASDFIHNVRAPGAPALFVLRDTEMNDEALFRFELTNAWLSLTGPAQVSGPGTVFTNSTVPVFINSSNYFAGTKTLRSLMPQFNGYFYVLNSLPDYTFGGFLAGVPAYQVEEQLRRKFDSYAGIYNGAYGVSDNNGYYNGSFAVFVTSNAQATLVGFDAGNGTGDGTSYGLFAQFTVERNGYWSFETNNVSGFGQFDSHGDFQGELDYTNGNSVYLTAYLQSPLGPFQNSAGNYVGTFTSQHSGASYAILAADGELFYASIAAGNNVVGSGAPQIQPNNTFGYTEVSGTQVQGTLTPATPSISGTTRSGGGNGSFSLTRKAALYIDLPPVITKDLPPNVMAQLGTNWAVSLVVTGSPPLSFQWYSNAVAIPFASSNVLVIPNLQYSSAATYSVTIDNLGGETNSQVVLAVVPETIPPTNQITAPVSGSQVSNALYTVTGKAGDNVAVSNVLVQINGGGWNPATTLNGWANWSLQVPLIPGSNTVQAYAVDTSGNVSPTSTVIFKYVVSAPLTVQLTGRGTISPNDSNMLLQVGAPYSITAAPVAGSGFAFSNWTGGVSLPLGWLTNGATVSFTMVSNLVLQANFVDTNRPVLAITNATTGMTVSNAVFVVKGTATDNVAVASVSCQLNGGGWVNASTLNGGSWTDALNLLPGANQFQAYATDTSGNVSPTNSINLVYVVSATLTVRTNGLGVLTPVDNGAVLQVGKTYSIAAAPATGFVFTNWTGGTSLPLGVLTNHATIQFAMVSNLLLQANFVETSRPAMTLSQPVAGQHMSNALAYVMGTASDNWRVAGVWCQLNSNAWVLAGSTNGWTNWSTIFRLMAGTNTIRAFAGNLGGNYSATSSVSVLSSNDFKLWLSLTNSQPVPGKGLGFALQLSAGLTGHIEVSSNLMAWNVLTNFVGSNATLNFHDPSASNGLRFYRAVVP